MAVLKAARARGRKGGRKFVHTKAQVRMAQAAMASRDTSVSELRKELGGHRSRSTGMSIPMAFYAITGNEFLALSVGPGTLRHQTPDTAQNGGAHAEITQTRLAPRKAGR